VNLPVEADRREYDFERATIMPAKLW